MKAIVQDKYGEPKAVLRLRNIDKPEIRVTNVDDDVDDEVLVRVRAVSTHVGDLLLIRGAPYILRFASGLRRPKNPVPGMDIAGTVEAVGKNVKQLQPGDEVFGWCRGAFAEYARAPENHFVRKPAKFSFQQAAAVGTSAVAALQALRDHGKLKAGQKLLINGASGGVGTFAVQIAKSMGASVTGVCSTSNVEMVRSIGADQVIDYTFEDFTKRDERYDLILDNVGNRSSADLSRVLTPTGLLFPNGGGHLQGNWIGPLGNVIKALVLSFVVPQQGRPFVSAPNQADLTTLKNLCEAGKLTPVIDRNYPLSEAPAAVAHVGKGHARGKVVITV